METVDKAGKWQDPRYFVSKLPYLQMPGPQSWSVCQPVLAPSRLQVPQNLYNPIDKTLGWNFYRNPSLPDKVRRLPDRWCVPSTLHRDMLDNLRIFLAEYLKIWKRTFLSMLPYEMSVTVLRILCPPSIRSWRRTKIEGVYCRFTKWLFWILSRPITSV